MSDLINNNQEEKVYTLTEKQLKQLVKGEVQLLKAQEEEKRLEEQLLKMKMSTQRYVFVPKDNFIAKIAGGLLKVMDLFFEIEKEKNTIARQKAEIRKRREIEIARKRGLI